MRYRSCSIRRALWALASLACACGAGHSPTPAAAQPRSSTSSALRAGAPVGAPRYTGSIGTGNVTRVQKLWEATPGGKGRAVAVSRKLRRVVTASGSPIRLFDLFSGKLVGAIDTCDDVVRGGMAFANRKLVVVCERGVRLYEGKKPSLQKLSVNAAKITAAAFAWPWLALGHHDGVIRIYGLDGSPTIEIPVPGPPIDVKSLALTRDGSRVAVAWIQGSIWWWETAKPKIHHRLVRRENESDTVAFSHDAALFAEEGVTSFTTVWDFAASQREQAQLRNGAWVKRILFTRDSKWLVRGGSDGLEIAEIAGPQRVALDTRGSVEDIAMDEQGSVIAAVDRDGRLTAWAPR